jgi:ABC-2 type transport system ATP-binding protein
MDRGKVIALDTPQNLVSALNSECAIEFRLTGTDDGCGAGATDMRDLLLSVKNVKRVDLHNDVCVLYTDQLQETLTDWIALANAKRLRFTDLRTRTATLEDAFIRMTGRSLSE